MKRGFTWVPDLKVMEQDLKEYEELIAQRRATMLEDHKSCGRIYPIWLTDKQFVDKLRHGIREWIEARDGMVSYESWGTTVLVSFFNESDALLYKLTWGGA